MAEFWIRRAEHDSAYINIQSKAFCGICLCSFYAKRSSSRAAETVSSPTNPADESKMSSPPHHHVAGATFFIGAANGYSGPSEKEKGLFFPYLSSEAIISQAAQTAFIFLCFNVIREKEPSQNRFFKKTLPTGRVSRRLALHKYAGCLLCNAYPYRMPRVCRA